MKRDALADSALEGSPAPEGMEPHNRLFLQHFESIPIGEKNPLKGGSQGDTRRAGLRNGRAAHAPKENADSEPGIDSSASSRENHLQLEPPGALGSGMPACAWPESSPAAGTSLPGTNRAISQDRSYRRNVLFEFAPQSLLGRTARHQLLLLPTPEGHTNLAHRRFHSGNGEIHTLRNRRIQALEQLIAVVGLGV